MVCRPKLPTGEKKPTKFQAPIFYPTDQPEQLQRLLGQAFGAVQEDLAGLHDRVDTPPLTTPVTAVSGVVMAKAGDVLRLMPGPAGIQVLLPTARATNKGQDVSIIVQGATGNVTVRAVEGKVQGVASVTLTGDGLRVFRSDGGDGTATGAGGWWIVGRNSADSSAQLIAVSAGTQVLSTGTLVFSNNHNVSFGLSNGTLTALADQKYFGLPAAVDGQALSFANTANFSWSVSSFTYIDGAKTNTGAQYTPQLGSALTADSQIGLVSHIGGNQVSSVTRLAFSNASNVTWSLSTAANAATVIASVAAGGGGGETKTISLATYPSGLSSSLSNATDTAFSGNPLVFQSLGTDLSAYSRANVFWRLSGGSMVGVAPQLYFASTQIISGNAFSFLDGNGLTWNLTSSVNDPNFGRIVQVSGNYAGPRAVSAGTQSMSVGTLVFANSNNFSWGMSGSSQITGQAFFNVTGANGSSVNATVLAFTTGVNNVGFAVSTNASGATVRAAASISVSAGTTNVAASQLSFANSNGVSFGLNGSTITASVAAAAGGGIALSDTFGNAITSGSAFLSQQTNSTLSQLWSAVAFSNNVMFGITGQSVTAQAHMRFADATGGNGNAATRMNMVNSNGLRWGTFTTESAAGAREFNFTGTVDYSAIAPAINIYMNNGVGSGYVGVNSTNSLWVTPFLHPMPGRITADTFEMFVQPAGANSSAYSYTLRGGIYTLNNSTQLTLINSFSTTASSTTQATSAWGNLIAGDRYITVNSSLWSSSPVFSAGVQYWIGLVQATGGGVALIPAWLCNRFFQIAGSGFRGNVGVSQAANLSKNQEPFMGVVNTTGIPVSIGTAGLLDAPPTHSAAMPMFNLRQGIFR